MSARHLRRSLVGAAAGATVLLALPTAAGAHVEATSVTAEGTTTVTLSFHHGCDGAPTTSLRVQLPEGASDVVAEDPPGWTSTITGTELAWTGGEVPDAQEAAFVATMTLSDAEGTTVFLPTVQGCTGGAEEAWIDRSEDPEAAAAAPRITAGAVVAASGHGSGSAEDDHSAAPTGAAPGTTAAETHATSAPADDHASSDQAMPAGEDASHSSSSNAPLIIGILVAIVVIGAIIAVVVSRRSPSTDA